MPNQLGNLFRRSEEVKEQLSLEERYILIFGDLHQLNLGEERDIMLPSQMTRPDSLTSIFFGRKMKPPTLTKNMKHGQKPSYQLESKFFIQTEEGSIKGRNLPYTSNPEERL
jgi:hypothetical protein